eukprot:Sspe_Gene.31041::Locus_15325_Transcript_3_3_Confidence_0.500_Length_1633::g.31041::m.31041
MGCVERVALAMLLVWCVPCHASHAGRLRSFHRLAPRKLSQRLQVHPPKHLVPYDNHVSVRDLPGADPTGRNDSTAAVQAAMKHCTDLGKMTPGEFAVGAQDLGGCVVDLAGGEYMISQSLVVPSFTANLRVQGGSLRANPNGFKGDFLLVIGNAPCRTHQGSCVMDMQFHDLFLDGSHVAGGMQINDVMGVTVGPGAYFLNFTGYGIQVNGGHEVMVNECWLGEHNFDFRYGTTKPTATAIQINSNDHYVTNTIVFASLVGMDVNGAANMIEGVHVWFPWNVAEQFGATAFLVRKGQNRFVGCYVDNSKMVLQDPVHVVITASFMLGSTVHITGTKAERLQITASEFQGNGGIIADPSVVAVDTLVEGNMFTGNGSASRLSREYKSLPKGHQVFDLCPHLVFRNITSAKMTALDTATCPVSGPIIDGCTVSVSVSQECLGAPHVFLDIDTSTPSAGCGLC